MAERRTDTGRPQELHHGLGSQGDQDILRGPPASDRTSFVTIGQADDPFEADLLASALEEAGFSVAARAQRDFPVDTLVDPTRPYWAIQVPEQDEASARAVFEARLEELRDSRPEAERAAEEEEALSEEPTIP